ncbi:MAG: MMPL family transporter [Kiritimatiellae bacterium]|nr:MMPL family transporter [Kiritimatiellia bacterium]
MRDRLLQVLFRLSTDRPKATIVLVAILTLIAAVAVPRLRITSGHSDLCPSSHPDQARYLAFLKEFGAANDVVIVLEGEPAVLRAAADRFANELARETNFVRSVFYKIDVAMLLDRAPLFMPEQWLDGAESFLAAQPRTVETLVGIDSLPALLRAAGDAMSGRLPGLAVAPAWAPRALDLTHAFFSEWLAWLREPARRAPVLDALAARLAGPEAAILATGGYLCSRDGRLLFLFVRPLSARDDAAYLRPLDRALRGACARVFAAEPALRGKVSVALTGMPAHVLTEVTTIYTDVGRAGLVAVALVAAILLVGFRSLRTTLVALIPLCAGIVLTLGLVTVTVGRLNLMSSSFLAVLFGIGIDFAIYLVRRTEEELGKGRPRPAAVREAVTATGKSVLSGGLSTSLAFFAVGCCEFIGFSELGITAGLGVLVVMLTTLLMLPALLVLVPIRPRLYRAWPDITPARRRRRRAFLYTVLGAALLLAGLGAFCAKHLAFDFNALHLLPADSESTVYQLRMQDESDFQMTCAAVTAGSLAELRALETRIRALPTVSRIDSLSRVIPADQAERLAVLARCGALLPERPHAEQAETPAPGDYTAALDLLTEQFEAFQEQAFAAGHAELVRKLDANLTDIEAIRTRLAGNPDVSARIRTAEFDQALRHTFGRLARMARGWLNLAPLREDACSPAFVARFKSPRGNYVAYVYPNGHIWDFDFTDRFVAELRSVTPNVTGFPVTLGVNARMAVRGLHQALTCGLAMIVVLLTLDFHRLRLVLLALVPLAIAMFWLQAVVYASGLPYNYASMAGLPLLLGLGVVYGVHIVHRWLENPRVSAFAAVATAGRGVMFAALTTVAGLGSITFARHKGVSSFGWVILLGILTCLAAAMLVLPAAIDLFCTRRQERNPHETDPLNP